MKKLATVLAIILTVLLIAAIGLTVCANLLSFQPVAEDSAATVQTEPLTEPATEAPATEAPTELPTEPPPEDQTSL